MVVKERGKSTGDKGKTDRRNIKTALLIPLAAGANSWRWELGWLLDWEFTLKHPVL